MYMAGTTLIPQRFDHTIGVIQTALQRGVYSRVVNGVPWCLDNGVFTYKFQVDLWLKQINKFSAYKNTCLFITIPDIVGDASATINQFMFYRAMVQDYPVAFVSQDGIKDIASAIPWNDFDCLFVGGTDNHKLGVEGKWIMDEAKRHGKRVHIGRVNSISRLVKFWQADSWDGTHLGFMPSDAAKFNAAVLLVRKMKLSTKLFKGEL
jgi:hypothetical protein